MNEDSVATRFYLIKERIRKAALSCGRDPSGIKLVAVSKTVPVERIQEAIAAGATILGENYVQEARAKIESLGADSISWHFIGHLQTNKAKYAVRLFDLIHSVDSLKLAQELDKRAKGIGKVQDILIQVNLSREMTKSGIDPKETIDLIRSIAPLENVSIRGLMTIPPYFNDPERARPFFRALKELRALIVEENIPNVQMTELSMGMTGDFETAISEEATIVRIGTAIFGKRPER
nr:YggS family pyridoxal phosphate-dependent enzyme [Desulfobacterales bacterium]